MPTSGGLAGTKSATSRVSVLNNRNPILVALIVTGPHDTAARPDDVAAAQVVRTVAAFGVAKAGILRLTESLACELAGTGARVFAMHPGFVRTPMTEGLARGDQGRAWLPDFGPGAQQRWGDARAAADLVEAIAGGAADDLAGRLLRAGDDLRALAVRCRADPDYRRLRLNWAG